MLIVTLISFIVMIIGIVIAKKSQQYDVWGIIAALIAGLILSLFLIVWPLNYFSTESEINQYYQAKQTVQKAREHNSIENAALMQKIFDTNKWLADNKYWRNTMFKDMIPSEIDNLKPLE